MTSRERVEIALNHKEPDFVPIDFGGTAVSSMHVSNVYKLRQALKLDLPNTPVKVVEPYQMLGEIGLDLVDALNIDVLPLGGRNTLFGFPNENWREWMTFDGTPVLVPEGFNTKPEPDGSILLYPGGDKTAKPSGRMPKGGFYFDAIAHQEPLDDDNLRLEDNLEEFQPISNADLKHLADTADRLYNTTDKAIMASFGGTAFGDIAIVPGMNLKNPKGIRGVEEWYISTVTRRDFVYKIFEKQCEIAIKNFEKIYQAVGDKIVGAFITGTDFGTQRGPFISLNAYRDLYKPFHLEINRWIHKNTKWKSFIHSCGSVEVFLNDFIDAGFDILNPVQCSAEGMEPKALKEKYGDRLTFWGGGIDTQRTLPFGTPEEVKKETAERLKIFKPGGGFVFNGIHNLQCNTPTENLLAMFEALSRNR